MSPQLVFFKSIFWVLSFLVLTLSLGKSIPKGWLLANRWAWVQQAIIGFSLLVIILRIPFREDFPVSPFVGFVTALSFYGVVKWLIELQYSISHNGRGLGYLISRFRVAGWCLIAIIPSLIIVYFPLIASHAVFYQNYGPDLDGDLMSSSFISEGHTWNRLMMSLRQASGSFEWWNLANHPWSLADFREGVAVEFFPRSLRWGHAVLTALISHASGEPIWFSFFVLTVFAIVLCPFVIIDACLSLGINKRISILISFALMGTQTYALMLYEGIVVQLIATPILLYFMLNFKSMFLKEISLGQKFVLAILLSGLVSTFGEGIQILAVFTLMYLLVFLFYYRSMRLTVANPLTAIFLVIALWVAISPTIFVDFLLWSYARSRQAFVGGALHFDWSIFSLLIPVSYMKLSQHGLNLLVQGTQYTRLFECFILLFIGGILIHRKEKLGLDFSAGTLAIAVFVLVNHRYAIWKIMAIYQPFMMLCIFQILPEEYKLFRKNYLFAFFAVFSFLGLLNLVMHYRHFATPAHLEQFNVDRNGTVDQKFALLTPSMSRVYLKLGSQGEIFWANGGWRGPIDPNFSLGGYTNLPIAFYFDCDAEGKSRCEKIKQFTNDKMTPRKIYLTTQPINSLLDEKGVIKREAINKFIRDHYGIEPAGGERQSDS